MKKKDVIMGIDPGREKCGIALLTSDLQLQEKTIIPTAKLSDYIQQKKNDYYLKTVVVGSGTFSGQVEEMVKEILGHEIELQIVNETRTTLEAEKRYIQRNYSFPLRLLNKIINWKPSEPVDDLAAVILVEKYLLEK